MTLDEGLAVLERFGLPTLTMSASSASWVCWVNVSLPIVGGKFEISSDYNKHKTPTAAVEECVARLRDAMTGVQSMAIAKGALLSLPSLP
jgi:hypothetical protein